MKRRFKVPKGWGPLPSGEVGWCERAGLYLGTPTEFPAQVQQNFPRPEWWAWHRGAPMHFGEFKTPQEAFAALGVKT